MTADDHVLHELADAARALLDAHLGALAEFTSHLDVVRARAFLDTLAADIEVTLTAEIRARSLACAPRARAPASFEDAAFAQEAARIADGDDATRFAWAEATALKRVDELSGVLFTYRSALSGADDLAGSPAKSAAAFFARTAAAHVRFADQGARVVDALHEWARAAPGAAGSEAAPPESPLIAARRARILFHGGARRDAVALAADALERALADAAAEAAARVPDVGARFARAENDVVLAARLIDFVEYHANVLEMRPPRASTPE